MSMVSSPSVSTSSAPGVDGGQRDLVGVDAVPRHGDQAARLELPGDRAGAGQLAAGSW